MTAVNACRDCHLELETLAWMKLETIRDKVELGPRKWQIYSQQVALSHSRIFVALDEQAQADLGMMPSGWTELKDESREGALEAPHPQRYIDLRTSGPYPSVTEDFVDYLARCHRFA